MLVFPTHLKHLIVKIAASSSFGVQIKIIDRIYAWYITYIYYQPNVGKYDIHGLYVI